MGTNENEGNIFIPILAFAIPGLSLPLTVADLTIAFDHFFNSNATVVTQILDEYPLYNYKNPEQGNKKPASHQPTNCHRYFQKNQPRTN